MTWEKFKEIIENAPGFHPDLPVSVICCTDGEWDLDCEDVPYVIKNGKIQINLSGE